MTADRPAGRRVKRPVLVITPIVLAAVTAAAVLGGSFLRPVRPAAAATTTGSAPVVRTSLTSTVQVTGSLSYAGTWTVVNQALGTAFTALPAVGTTIRRGRELYEVDGAPVTLFYGARPEWRALSVGVAAGPDVAQLDRNLIALGYGAGLTVSDYFTAATAYAVERWQSARGLPVTGTVPLGQVAYAPGSLRVTGVNPVPGAPPQPGASVLIATSVTPVVVAQLPVGQEYLVKAGDDVTVTLPDGATTTPGIVAAVSAVASASSGSPSGAAGPQATPSTGGGPGQDVVPVTVRLTHPPPGHLDQAPVTVNITSARASDVLAVPISALVALAVKGDGEVGGGYAVEVVHGSARHLVAVQTGLFAQTLVQVSGAGLAVGMRVEVPSS